MSSKLYTHTEIQLSDILHKIWENKISINNEDLNKLYEFTIKKYDNEK